MPAKDTKKSIWVIIFLPANLKEIVTCVERFPQEMIWLPQEIFFGVGTYGVSHKKRKNGKRGSVKWPILTDFKK